MNKSVLQNGDLLFMNDESDLSKAIIETTEKYSHVGIFFDGMFYHASRKRGVAKQKLEGNYSAPKIPGIMQEFQQRQVLQLQKRLLHVFLLSRYKNGF